MPEISGSPSAAHSAASVRNELATTFVRDAAKQDQAVAEQLRETKDVTDEQRDRENRQIPGLGNAVDISV